MKKYIKSILSFVTAFLLANVGMSQTLEREVINSCGGTLAPPGGPKLTQNIGETFATRLTGGGATLTQGYLQNTTSAPAAITGTMSLCAGATTTLSYPVGGGTWSSNTPSVATVGSTGIVTGIAAGTSIISYVAGSTSVAATVTVLPSPAAITGTTNICAASTTTFASANAGGIWTSSNSSVASVGSATGVVTGASAGSAQITYTLPSGCFVTRSITVNPLVDAGTISGPSVTCPDNTILLSNTASGGSWNSSDAGIASVDEFGLVYGVTSGTATISYVLPGTCGSAVATKVVTVSTLPTASPITGVATVCAGNTTTLSNASPGGSWSSSNTAVGTVATTGVVTGISTGTSTISYIVTTDCGTALTTRNVTVTPGTVVSAITGTATLCSGGTTTLSSATTGGSWTSSNPEIASVGTSGIVTGNASGTATISYSVMGSCGIARATRVVSVNTTTSPGAITGTATVCAGSSTTLSSTPSGGTWTSSNPEIASIGTSGIVTGNAAGTATISYTLTDACGTATVTKTVTVNASPAGSITGTSSVCVGNTISLNHVTPGGTWSSSLPAIGTVNATTGVVTGISSGTVTITYTTGAGVCYSTKTVTVNALPLAIGGITSVCQGATTSLTNTTAGGGYWSNDGANAMVDTSGIVTGITAGTSVISFQTNVTNCLRTVVVTVNAAPSAGSITGSSSVNVGATIALSNATTGGTWSSSNTSVATVGSAGIVTGIAAGTTTISYSVTNSCSTAYVTSVVTVNASLETPITGTLTVCAGSTTTLTHPAIGGTWSSSNTIVATVGSTGMITGVAAGTATISYNLGGSSVTAVITVTPTPSFILGTMPVVSTTDTVGLLPYSSVIGTPDYSLVWDSVATAAGFASTMPDIISTIAGHYTMDGSYSGDEGPATSAGLYYPSDVAFDASGNLYIADQFNHRVRKVTPSGIISTVVGVGSSGYSGDGGPATAAHLSQPSGIAIDSSGNLYIADKSNHKVRKVTPSGIISTVATMNLPYSVALDASGNLFISQQSDNVIRKLTPSGIISTLAGNGTSGYSGDGGPATAASLKYPEGLAVDASGNLYFADSRNKVIRKVAPSGIITTVAGNGIWDYSGDGGPATAAGLRNPSDVAFDASGNLYIADMHNYVIRKVTTSGIISTVVGGGIGSYGYSGDGGPATAAGLQYPYAVAFDTSGNLYIADGSNHVIRKVVSNTEELPASPLSISVPTSVTPGTYHGNITLRNGPCTNTYPVNITVTGGTGTCGTISVPDTINICGGSSTAITATATPAGTIDGILWTPSTDLSSTSSASTTFTGTSSRYYTVTMLENAGPNLIINANFEAGNTGFTSGYTYEAPFSSALWLENKYTITTNPSLCHPESYSHTDHTSGTGKMMCINGASTPINVWTQTVNVTPNTNYDFTAWVTNWSLSVLPSNCPILHFQINGSLLGQPDTILTPSGTWRQFRSIWNSGTSTTATIVIRNVTTAVIGNDFSLDDISFRSVCTAQDSVYVNVGSPAPAITVSGEASVCAGSTKAFSAAATGTWSSSNTAIASVGTTGIVTGIAAGIVTISFHTSTNCYSTRQVTVNPAPSTIAGNSSVCIGTPFTYSNAATGGIWSRTCTPSGAFAIDASTGIATASTTGTGTITYAIGICLTTKSISAIAQPNAITGTATMCTGSTTTLSCTTTGGTWSSSNEGVATVATGTSTTGIVSGVSAGTATIYYTNAGGCARAFVVTVTAAPPAIVGGPSVCLGGTITLTNATTGGTWSSSTPAVSSINSISGVARGNSVGNATITYTINSTCRTTSVLTVTAAPAAITGLNRVCIGSSLTLAHETSGGTWSSSTPAKASVGATSGVVTGLAAGTTTITYATGSGGCFTTKTVSVNALPSAIGGTATVCEGANTTLTNATSGGGFWSTSGTNATVSTTGTVTGIAAGTSVITFEANTTTCRTTRTVTINTTPTAVGGAATLCIGSATTLTSTPAGGTWQSSNMTAAPINPSTGSFTAGGTASASAIISYTMPTGCRRTTIVTVSALPGTLSGGTTPFCVGNTTNITATTASLVWSSTNTAVATVAPFSSITGQVTGLTPGTATISYTNSAGCARTVVVTVSSATSDISGPAEICVAGTATMTSTTGGGTWTSSNTTRATIVSTTGEISGVALGSTTITYRTSATCFATKTVNVVSAPSGTITGPAGVCIGSDVTFTYPSMGGTWVSSNTSRATVDSTSGLVAGVAQGTTILTYNLAPGCYVTKPITVFPYVFPISGTYSVCVGSTATLNVAQTGGTWTISNTAIGNLSYAGAAATNLTGLSAGTATVTFLYPSTGCYSLRTVTVQALPMAITGSETVCINADVTLANGTVGGTWASSAGISATVNAVSGVVTGVSASTCTITYTAPNSCVAVKNITVNPLPGAITGTSTIGTITTTSATLGSVTAGGEWTSSDAGVATIGLASGVVTSVSAGTTNITYTIPATGCFRTRVQTVVAGRPMAGTTSSTDAAGNTRIFPTPTTGMLTVEAAVSGNFKVMTIDGRIVAQYPINAASTTINLPSDLAAGIYMCRFEGVDGVVETLKVVLTK